MTIEQCAGRPDSGRRARRPPSIERIADSDPTEIGDLHPPDSELALAGEHCSQMHLRKTVNHQPTKHLCAKPVRQHECLSASCWAAGEQLKGRRRSPIAVMADIAI
jgi:hypothetical protein